MIKVHVVLGKFFEDVYVEARTITQAIKKAKKVTTIKHRFANFIV